jgi:hypothetical protein
MIRVFIGVDSRQPVAFQVLAHSIYKRASVPVSITPLVLSQLPMKRRGLTDFTFTRYLCPFLCDFRGVSVFFDADMLMLGDIDKLVSFRRAEQVSVVKGQLRFEWPSMMVFNNHLCESLTPEYIENGQPNTLEWSDPIGELPSEWNHCVGYDAPRKDAKLVHFTQGIPCFPETKDSEYAAEWMAELKDCNSTVSWNEIMGTSVHAKPVRQRLQRTG